MELTAMTSLPSAFQTPVIDRRVVVIVGGFGSGKSEVSVNLAQHLARTGGKPVAIADLDIINPYFRSREAADILKTLGIESIMPEGELRQADLPVIIPNVKAAIEAFEGYSILDVGGDDLGARVLKSLGDAFQPGDYDLLLVLNRNRPFTADLDGSLTVIGEIKAASGLDFTGIISNTHLMDLTDRTTVLDGLELSRRVAQKTGIPLRMVSMVSDLLDQFDPNDLSVPVLTLDRSLLKPWERH
jgi:hypothetical protein